MTTNDVPFLTFVIRTSIEASGWPKRAIPIIGSKVVPGLVVASACINLLLVSVPDLRGADLSEAQASGIEFFRCDLSNADFRRANLRNANFRSANIKGAQFAGADMGVTILRETNLEGVDLSGVDLTTTLLPKGYTRPAAPAAKQEH